jgi:hypothetical protein
MLWLNPPKMDFPFPELPMLMQREGSASPACFRACRRHLLNNPLVVTFNLLGKSKPAFASKDR